MRNFIFCLLALGAFVFTGCATTQTKYIESVHTLDYSQYTKDGFFVTESNSVNFDYTPLGSISTFIYAGKDGKWYYDRGVIRDGSKYPSPSRALTLTVAEAKKLGANAIINLKIAPASINIIGVEQSGIMLTGMAVKK